MHSSQGSLEQPPRQDPAAPRSIKPLQKTFPSVLMAQERQEQPNIGTQKSTQIWCAENSTKPEADRQTLSFRLTTRVG